MSFTSCAPNQDQECINNKQGHFLNFDFWTTEVSHSLCLISLQSTSGLCGVCVCVCGVCVCVCVWCVCGVCVCVCVCVCVLVCVITLQCTVHIISVQMSSWLLWDVCSWMCVFECHVLHNYHDMAESRHPITNRADDRTRHGRGLKIGNVSKSRVLT